MIRTATIDDLDELTALAARTFPLACPPGMPAADIEGFMAANLSRSNFETYLVDPGHTVFVDDSLSGYVLLIDESPVSYLSKCYVDPAAHGSGLAGDLISHATDWAASRGFTTMRLGVNSQNPRAQRFYAKCGFEVTGTRKFVVGSSTEKDFVMELKLSD